MDSRGPDISRFSEILAEELNVEVLSTERTSMPSRE